MPPHLIDWAFVAALVTSAITIGTKWLLPALQKIGRGEDDASTAEWRGRVGAQLDQQDKALTALMEATTDIAKVVAEIERRGHGMEDAIRRSAQTSAQIASMAEHVSSMVPKLDSLLLDAATEERLRRAQGRQRRNR